MILLKDCNCIILSRRAHSVLVVQFILKALHTLGCLATTTLFGFKSDVTYYRCKEKDNTLKY